MWFLILLHSVLKRFSVSLCLMKSNWTVSFERTIVTQQIIDRIVTMLLFYLLSAMEQIFWFLTNLALIYILIIYMLLEIFKTVTLKMIILLQNKYFSQFSNDHKLASYLWTCPVNFEWSSKKLWKMISADVKANKNSKI